ncbi:MAG: peptidylprolyl isomerase [Planctomycetes bacterium]|nr:peptidylprolyl isomerase [Planctomycetota bacterium]
MSFATCTILSLALLAAPPRPLRPGADEDGLPAEAAAVVDGSVLSEEAFCAFVGHEYRHEERAQQLTEVVIQQRLIEAEAERRGITIAAGELEERLRQLEAETERETGGTRSLASLFQEHGVAREQFLPFLRSTLLAEELVRLEFRLPPGSAVPYEKTNIWLQDHLARAVLRRSDLPPGTALTVNGLPVTDAEVGRNYLADQPHRKKDLLTEFVDSWLVEREAAKAGIELAAQDIESALAERDERVRGDARYAGASLEELLAKTGRDLAWLKESTRFRCQMLLERLVDLRHPGAELQAFYEREIEYFDRNFGPAVRLRAIFLRAGPEGAKSQGFAPRLYEDAEAELRALGARIAEGEVDFAEAARGRSEHASAARGGDLGFIDASHPSLGELARAGLAAAQDLVPLPPLRVAEGVFLGEVTERRPKPAFEEIKAQVRRKAAADLIQGWRDAADIRRADA